jgi:hypothetical protein
VCRIGQTSVRGALWLALLAICSRGVIRSSCDTLAFLLSSIAQAGAAVAAGRKAW